MMTPDAGLKSTPSTSKPSEEDAQPHDNDEAYYTLNGKFSTLMKNIRGDAAEILGDKSHLGLHP